MYKLRIFSNDNLYNPENYSDFYIFFKDILKMLDEYLWVMSEDSFFLPIDWFPDYEGQESIELNLFENSILLKKDGHYLVDNNFIKKYGKYIRDDWNDLLCFKGNMDCFKKWIREMRDSQFEYLFDYLNEGKKMNFDYIQVLLENWDSAFWEIRVKNENYYNTVKLSIENRTGIWYVEFDEEEEEKCLKDTED